MHTQLHIRYQETRRQLTLSGNRETSSWRKSMEAAMTAITSTTVRFVGIGQCRRRRGAPETLDSSGKNQPSMSAPAITIFTTAASTEIRFWGNHRERSIVHVPRMLGWPS